MALCQRHRQSGIQVGSPTDLVGVVTREDLDKAIGHGLSHAPVKAVMGPGPVTCAPETTIDELQRLIAGSTPGRIPVADSGQIVGVVTRGDLLRALGETPSQAERTCRQGASRASCVRCPICSRCSRRCRL